MKVLFLDHDGVICLSPDWGSRYKKQKDFGCKMSQGLLEMPVQYRFDNFNIKSVKILNQILEETGAEIVISSDWKKWANVDEMGQYYESQGIIKKPIAFTPDLNDCTNYNEDFVWNKNWDLEQSRSFEIKQYLENHPEITHWVSVDDLDMSRSGEHKDWGLDNFVHTPKSNEGIKQTGVKEKIIKYLTDDIQDKKTS